MTDQDVLEGPAPESTLRGAARAVGTRRLVAVAVAIFVVHCLSPSVQVTDSRLSVFTASQVLHHGGLSLDSLRPDALRQVGWSAYDVVAVGEHHLPYFPYPPMLLLVPVVGVAESIGLDPQGLQLGGPNQTWKLEVPTAAALVALTAVIVMLGSMTMAWGEVAVRRRAAVLAGLLFGFGTAAWSTGSRALWQHTPAMLFLALGFVLLGWRLQHERTLAPVGVSLALAYIMRPGSWSSMVVVAVAILVVSRRQVWGYVAGAVGVFVPFVMVNAWQYHQLLPPYYNPIQHGRATSFGFAESLAVNLVSPARGLIVFTPAVLLIPFALVLRRRRTGSVTPIEWTLIATLASHAIAVAWYGSTAGSAYGARYFTEMSPIIVLLLVPVLVGLAVPHSLNASLKMGIVGLLALSCIFASIGATTRSAFCWSSSPRFIDEDPGRVWDLTDLQMLRPFEDLRDGRPLREIVAGSCEAPTG